MIVRTERVYDEYGNVIAVQYVHSQCTNTNCNLSNLNKYYLITQTLEPPMTKSETKPETKPESKPETKPESKPETKPESKPETLQDIKLKFICNTDANKAFEYLYKGNYIISYNDLESYLIKLNKLKINDLITIDLKNNKDVFFDKLFVEIIPEYSVVIPFLEATEHHLKLKNWSVWMLQV